MAGPFGSNKSKTNSKDGGSRVRFEIAAVHGSTSDEGSRD